MLSYYRKPPQYPNRCRGNGRRTGNRRHPDGAYALALGVASLVVAKPTRNFGLFNNLYEVKKANMLPRRAFMRITLFREWVVILWRDTSQNHQARKAEEDGKLHLSQWQ